MKLHEDLHLLLLFTIEEIPFAPRPAKAVRLLQAPQWRESDGAWLDGRQ
ncbi:MAG: hypothetical protein PHG44_02570 [Lentisphaeria bacterium]|jgi:hypothetical protein|nr:hypothetical protein [Lentisphaeria bacterium]MDY0176695.1 hypothetical protein [Lentisphaeria bacterium]